MVALGAKEKAGAWPDLAHNHIPLVYLHLQVVYSCTAMNLNLLTSVQISYMAIKHNERAKLSIFIMKFFKLRSSEKHKHLR
jgi:hypothetical protein